MDEIKDRQELLLEIEQLKLDNARLGQRMDKMRKWNNSLLQKNWQESEDRTLLEFSDQDLLNYLNFFESVETLIPSLLSSLDIPSKE